MGILYTQVLGQNQKHTTLLKGVRAFSPYGGDKSGVSQKTFKDFNLEEIKNWMGGGQIKLRKQQTKLPYQDGAPYVGTDKIDDVIDIINSMSSNQVGGFGQTLNPVGYYDMPEAGRLSKKSESQLSDAGYNKYAGDEEMETSTKAAIMFDLLQRGQYNNDLNALRQDFLKSDVRNISPQQEQGGMIKQYQQGGQMDRGAYPSKDLEMLQEYPISYKFFMDRRGEKAYYPEQDTLAARMFRGEINPNQAFSKALMLPFEDESRYGGGKQQMQPRKQQEIRNPQMYGPPDSLMGPDTTMGNLDDLLNYYMERKRNRRNKLNALTGDTRLTRN